MNIKIIVAAHKPYRMPDDPMYLPLHVGHVGKSDLGWQGDDSGDNISHKNTNYCELTGLYWAWKNLDADVIVLRIIVAILWACILEHLSGFSIPLD